VIPYSLQNTNLQGKTPGDLVNLEADILAKYVESLISR
jgi:riboflavin synthase alpha subunit